ncbi:glutamate formimidoyltransferase [Moorella sp. E306M]|uniref:glutamate formimidoyltransferase n=1 Tax=Moorella sp. E306M TaxID=2572683 RepID=UPI0010FFB91E|nr:glutamate formimidoyltransferase [Moorella sp. E306M]GEA18024.1 glutamate formiminotransferase [Moorella sp. E306M]
MKKYIHTVPNFSEGRRKEVIEAIVGQFKDIPGVKLIDYYPDPDFNRTVIEAIGEPEPLKRALLNMTGKAVELINMEEQSGAHPRIGAQDTIPLFPLKNISLEECKLLAEELGKEIYARFQLPVYLSGENARTPERKSLDFIRRGQYEGLKKVVHLPERAPDIGPAALHPTAGAVIVSAGTRPLVAYNIVLNSSDLSLAQGIAKAVRGPSGGFSTVRAVGLKYEERDLVAVSMNIFDYELTPLYRTFELVKREAARYGVTVLETQLVGTVPQESLIMVAEYFLQLKSFKRNQILENNLFDLS